MEQKKVESKIEVEETSMNYEEGFKQQQEQIDMYRKQLQHAVQENMLLRERLEKAYSEESFKSLTIALAILDPKLDKYFTHEFKAFLASNIEASMLPPEEESKEE